MSGGQRQVVEIQGHSKDVLEKQGLSTNEKATNVVKKGLFTDGVKKEPMHNCLNK